MTWFRSFLVILGVFTAPLGMAAEPTQPAMVDREAMFRTVHEAIPSLLDAFGAEAGLYQESHQLLEKLKFAYGPIHNHTGGYETPAYPQRADGYHRGIGLWFHESQGNFILNEGEPARTAMTLAQSLRDDIQINTKVIQDPKVKLDLLTVLQLMLHENFHYIGPRTKEQQRDLDAKIARLVKLVSANYREIVLPGNKEKILILSWPVKNSRNEAFAGYVDAGFIALKESPAGIEDWTSKLGKHLTRDQLLTLPINPPAPHFEPTLLSRELRWFGETVQERAGGVLEIRAHIERKDRPVRNARSKWDPVFHSRDIDTSYEFHVRLVRTVRGSWDVQNFHLAKSYQKVMTDLQVRLRSEKSAFGDWIVIADLSRELNQNETPKLKLVSGEAELELAPERTVFPARQLRFVIRRTGAESAPAYQVNSLILQGNRINFAEQALRLPVSAQHRPPSAVKIEKAAILTPFGWRTLEEKDSVNRRSVEPGEGILRLELQSEKDLAEIRFRMSVMRMYLENRGDVSFQILQPYEGAIIEPSQEAKWSYREVYEDIVLSAAQMRQERRGSTLVVEIPQSHLFQNPDLEDITVKQPISRFFTMSYNMHHYLGGDTGARRLQDLVLVTQDMKTHALPNQFSYLIETIPASRRKVNPGQALPPTTGRETVQPRSCRKAFLNLPQALPPGIYRTHLQVRSEQARKYLESVN